MTFHKFNRLVLISVIVFFLNGPKSSAITYQKKPNKRIGKQGLFLLNVKKSSRVAELVFWRGSPETSLPIKSFKITAGLLGDKFVRGDRKTPEGIYFTQNMIEGKNLPIKYGTRAIPIDFPNPFDLLQHKTGYGIWLHGVENNNKIEFAENSEGCVVFFNNDIEELSYWLKPNQSAVVISHDGADVNQPEDIEIIVKRTLDWHTAWQKRNIHQYMNFYSSDFVDTAGRKYKNFERYKERVFSTYRNINVNLTSLLVITHPKYSISLMNQSFAGDHEFSDFGQKILYWGKSPKNHNWYIVREVFKDKEPISLSSATNQDIQRLINEHQQNVSSLKSPVQDNNSKL